MMFPCFWESHVPVTNQIGVWFLGIPLLGYYTPDILGSIILYNHRPTRVLNTAQLAMENLPSQMEWNSSHSKPGIFSRGAEELGGEGGLLMQVHALEAAADTSHGQMASGRLCDRYSY